MQSARLSLNLAVGPWETNIYIDRERERQTDRDRQTKPFELRQICMWVQVNSLGDVCNAANPSMALAVLEAAFVTNAMQGLCRVGDLMND